MKKKETKSINRYTPKVSVGLTKKDIKLRQENGQQNNVVSKTSKSYGQIILENTFSFFSCVLFSIAIFFIICNTGIIPVMEGKKFGITKFGFLLPLLANIIIGSVQEIRSKRVLEKLSIVNKSHYDVIRESVAENILSDDIVADDIIILEAGQQVPVDAEILSGELEVNESLLTGESDNIKKHKSDKLLSGSFVISGKAYCHVEKVGLETYAMNLQSKVKTISKNKSELMKNIYGIIKVMSVVLFVLVGIALLGMLPKIGKNGVVWFDTIESLSAIAIGCIPTGLVLTTSVALAVSVINLAKHEVLVQELYSLENLSRVDVICFDKTGTLTDGSMNLVETIKIKQNVDIEGYVGTLLAAMPDKNATAIALIKHFTQKGIYTIKEVIPFSSDRKCSSIILDNGTKISLGAPEYILSTRDKTKYINQADEKAAEGLRVLALTVNGNLCAYFCLMDGIRSSAVKTIKYFNENSVDVKIISGDNPITVSKIAKECGVPNADKCINMQGVSLDKIPEIVEEFTVFGRINPEQKEAIVKALQAKNHKVAMTGDGVNDILALKAANASITFQSATDAAKGLADVVLMDNSFDHITNVVGQGRRVVNNIQRTSVLFLMKTFFIVFTTFISLCFDKGTTALGVENLYLMQITVTGISGVLLSLENTNKPIKGSFKSNVYPKAITSGLLLAIAALISVLLDNNGALPKIIVAGYTNSEAQKALATILVTITGTIVLLMICVPINKYKAFVLTLSSGLSLIMMTAYPNIFLVSKGIANSEGMSTMEFLKEDFMNLIQTLTHPFNFADSIYAYFNTIIFNKNVYIPLLLFVILAIPAYCFIFMIINYFLRRLAKKQNLNKIFDKLEEHR